jgi:hypothetical protein
MSESTEWHGREAAAGESGRQAPVEQEQEAAPAAIGELEGFEPPEMPTEPSDRDYWPPNGLWPTVCILGRYGVTLCSNQQTLWFHNITRRTAWNKAWEYFGVCAHKIGYYDDHGKLVFSE